MHQRSHLIQALLIFVAVSSTGCSQVSEQVADWLKPPSGSEMSVRIQDQAARGELQEALRKGEAFVQKRPAEAAEVHRTLSELYLREGDAVKAMQHMQMAVAKGFAPASESGSAPVAPAPREVPAPAAVQATVDGASAKVLPGGGLEVRAGGATAKVPD